MKSDFKQGLGTKSVFFDPELNPQGLAPRGYVNRRYPLKYPQREEPEVSVEGIPLPLEPIPKYFRFYKKQGEFEGKEAIVEVEEAHAPEMVPRVLVKRQKTGR